MTQAALVASHRKSSGFVCGHEPGAVRCEWPPSIGRLMMTKPEAFSCATSLSATTLDMVSADCDRASSGHGSITAYSVSSKPAQKPGLISSWGSRSSDFAIRPSRRFIS